MAPMDRGSLRSACTIDRGCCHAEYECRRRNRRCGRESSIRWQFELHVFRTRWQRNGLAHRQHRHQRRRQCTRSQLHRSGSSALVPGQRVRRLHRNRQWRQTGDDVAIDVHPRHHGPGGWPECSGHNHDPDRVRPAPALRNRRAVHLQGRRERSARRHHVADERCGVHAPARACPRHSRATTAPAVPGSPVASGPLPPADRSTRHRVRTCSR